MQVPVLDIVKAASFSYPINTKYPNTFACSGIQAGLLVAYASGNDIVVLVEGRYITAVLKGHQHEVCAIAFEARGPYIVSADVENNVMNWHCQDLSSWQNGRSIKLSFNVISLAWYASRSKICVGSKSGLFLSGTNDIEKNCERLCASSSFCAFNFDGSLLASHDHKRTVTVFTFVGRNQMLTQVVRHPANVELMDFHPSLPAFLTITRDKVLRIWRQSVLGTFACTSSVKVSFLGRFVKSPSMATEKRPCGPEKPVKIGFVLHDGKRVYLKVDENGRMDTGGNPALVHNPAPNDMKLQAIIKTNQGSEAILTGEKGITILVETSEGQQVTTNKKDVVVHKMDFVVHKANIVNAVFCPESSWMYSLDENGWLVIWPIFNPYAESGLLAKHVEAATWLGDKALVYCRKGELYRFDIASRLTAEYDFPNVVNCRKLFALGSEIVAVGDNELIFKDHRHHIGEYRKMSVSRVYDGNALALVLRPNNEIVAYMLPSFEQLECTPRSGAVIDAQTLTINSFALLTDSGIEIWFFLTDKFVMIHSVSLPGMKGIYPDSSDFCGRIIAFDDTHLFEVENGIKCILRSEKITGVATNGCGHCAVFYGPSFEVYPSWCIKDPPSSHRRNLDSALTVKTMTADDKFLLSVCKQSTRNFMIAPRMFLDLGEEVSQEVEATLFHLMEFSVLDKLDNCRALQVPAMPNQYPIAEAMILPHDYHRPVYVSLYTTLRQISEDIDLFGLRYLLAINETVWPPSVFALWLAFSYSQSQIAEYLIKTIDTNNLSKFYISIGIKLHATLVKIVRAALSNMWATVQKIEPVAILHAAMGQVSMLSRLYNAIGDNQRADFFEKDFKQEKFRKSALRNAYSSLRHHSYEMAATLFLVAGDMSSAIRVILDKLNDPLLAFLVVRLKTKSNYESEEMKSFLSSVKWNDDIAPFLVSHLMGSAEAVDLLRNSILETETATNISTFGDRRIALFQIYYYLTKSTDIVSQLAMNLTFDGMAPLAEYLISFIESPFSVIRSAGGVIDRESSESDVKEHPEEEESRIMVQKDESFNFGGWDAGIDDDSDDDWSDSDEESQEKESTETNEQPAIQQSPTQERPVQTLLAKYTKEQIHSLCYFFGLTKKNDVSGALALHFGETRIAAKLLSEERMDVLFTHLSLFIDYCSLLFFDSVYVPLTERELFNLCKLLLELLPGCPEHHEMDLKTILSMPKNGYLHSVFCGCFVVAMWTYMHPFLAQILSDEWESVHVEVDNLPAARTFLDVDLQSPKFPDSVPELLASYAQSKKFLYLDSDRLLIMSCLFGRVVEISEQFHDSRDTEWKTKLLVRFKSMLDTLRFYQVALGCPSLEPPNIEAKDPLTRIILNQHRAKMCYFLEIQKEAIKKLPYPPILRDRTISARDGEEIKLSSADRQDDVSQVDDITSLTFLGSDQPTKLASSGNPPKKFVFISSGNLYMLSLEQEKEKILAKVARMGITETYIKVVGHPLFNNLFAALGQKGTVLYDTTSYDNPNQGPCVRYILSSSEKPTCVAFSPNGSKIAICTDVIDIFPFDVSQREAHPSIQRNMKGRITAVAWVNSDTILAVSYTLNGVSSLAIVDTLAKYDTPVRVNQEWGEITAISVEQKRGRLVVATDREYLIAYNIKQNYAPTVFGPLNKESPSAIVSMASLYDLSVVASEQEVVAVNTSTGETRTLTKNRTSIRAVAIADTLIAAVGKSNTIWIWR